MTEGNLPIHRAIISCHQSGNDAGHHFARVRKVIKGGKRGGGRAITYCGKSGNDALDHFAGAGKMIALGMGDQGRARLAVKIVYDRGIESLKVMEL